ncbi:hypothetical protein [Escherichia coli]|jgi:hypothetical protein|uniref:hypothetical protein n=1 Tax=Escherichia coli TaxID=562 RepID=UPI001449DEC8|nr:hypothetical protein [Escherichia coli]QJB54780.1 hypothetical protein HF562_24380 [Escherichia coli]QRQ46675.1 hypothetical protein JSQ77_24390 [Escherichia coli]
MPEKYPVWSSSNGHDSPPAKPSRADVSCHSVITPHAGFVEYTLKAHSLSVWLFYCKYSLNWLGQSRQLKKAINVIKMK